MTSIDDTRSNTHPGAAAWASSPLGDPRCDGRYGTGPTEFGKIADARPSAKRALLAAALACGVIGGATLGAVVFGGAPSAPFAVIPAGPVAHPVPTPAVVAPNAPAPHSGE